MYNLQDLYAVHGTVYTVLTAYLLYYNVYQYLLIFTGLKVDVLCITLSPIQYIDHYNNLIVIIIINIMSPLLNTIIIQSYLEARYTVPLYIVFLGIPVYHALNGSSEYWFMWKM